MTLDDLEDRILNLLDAGVTRDAPIEVILDGYKFEIEKIKYDNDGVLRICLKS